ncbi:hypothetical protein GY45DRAFT_767200 [Cubamyces sp. BRFM 1775]|nr:hypothetical protein GY45DRAFT_767200 [Cubamyces sp. BRFM 1775]
MNAGRLADEPVPARTLPCFCSPPTPASQIHTHPIRRMSLSLSIFPPAPPHGHAHRVSPPHSTHLLFVCLCTARAQPAGRDNCEGLDRSGRSYVASRGASQGSGICSPPSVCSGGRRGEHSSVARSPSCPCAHLARSTRFDILQSARVPPLGPSLLTSVKTPRLAR